MFDEKKVIEFQQYCLKTLQDSHGKYGDDYLYKPLGRDLVEEIRDIANYANLVYCRVKEIESTLDDSGNLIKLLESKDTRDLIHIYEAIGVLLDERAEAETTQT